MKVKEDISKISPECVLFDDVFSLYDANTATFQTSSKTELVVKPRNVKEIVDLVKFSSENKLTIYTISQGKNWGFGSKVPVKNCCILMDLSQMNKIVSYDEKFGTVRIEPGVTFRQLSEFLVEKGDDHFLNTIGGDPEASVMGNLLERGDGVGPYCERAAYACHSEIITSDGEIVDIGYGNIDKSRLSDLNKEGIGPGFQELFYQSNFGIVSKITIWLQKKPAFFRTFSFAQNESNNFPKLLECIRNLYRKRIINSPITFWNDYKQLASSIQFPHHLTEVNQPLLRDKIKAFSNDYSTWYAFGGVYVDSKKVGRAILGEVFSAIKPFIKRKTIWSQLSTSKVKLLRRFNGFLGLKQFNFDQLIHSWEENHLLGHTTGNSIKSLFWRKKRLPPKEIDPNNELCGVLWNSFLVPFDGNLIAEVLAAINMIILENGFEPVISFITLNDRYIKVFQQLIFDREDLNQDKKALECHQLVFEYLEKMGCSHSRLDILHMQTSNGILKNDSLHKKIKQALDPVGIFSPGRYFS
ncbi:MAG: FAD-dependent oxidoreductase [Saprospiraceae bacterium]|nr:FAD-dependent oxidoreductase [Saprospiraceae bacterium]